MVAYAGALDDSHALILFFRNEAAKLRTLRKIVITREKTSVHDVNGDGIEFPGLTYGSPVLERLMQELGVVFTPANLHNPNATPSGVKQFDISARWTWGHDRIL
jgi:hypothetical protein